MQNLCKRVKYSLLNSWKWLHVSKMVRRCTDRYTREPSHRQMFLIFLQPTEPSNWPPNSPDLNPVYYSIWGALPQLVYHQKFKGIGHLNSCWDMISQEQINDVNDQWSKQLLLVVRSHSRCTEHRFH